MTDEEANAIRHAPLRGSEPHFIELNKALEEKVNSLVSEVDLILEKQIHIMHMPKPRPMNRLEPKNTSSELNNIKSARKEISQAQHNYEINWTSGLSTSQTVICFFKGQVTKLQTDLNAMQYEKNKMEEKCQDLEAQIFKEEKNKEKLLYQQNHFKDSILKIETANSQMCSKMQAQNYQIISLQKEIEILKKKLISASQLSTCNESRINRSLEENDKIRSALKISQIQEKELREYIRKIQEEKRLALKNSEKQRTEIFQAFKKQVQLVNNLKKQKSYLEINKEVQLMEREFTKILEWKVD